MNCNVTALRGQKEKRLHQHGKVIWMTGLSGAGKTTLANHLEKELGSLGYITRIIDNDRIRSGLNRDLGYSEQDRHENLRRIAEVAKLFCETGVIVVTSFISPTEFSRAQARGIIGGRDFILLYVNASLEVCEQRDVKGLYKKARKGLLPMFTGVDSPFEFPANIDLEVRTDSLPVQDCIEKIMNFIVPQVEYSE